MDYTPHYSTLQCAICLSALNDDDPDSQPDALKTLPCSCTFHSYCIDALQEAFHQHMVIDAGFIDEMKCPRCRLTASNCLLLPAARNTTQTEPLLSQTEVIKVAGPEYPVPLVITDEVPQAPGVDHAMGGNDLLEAGIDLPADNDGVADGVDDGGADGVAGAGVADGVAERQIPTAATDAKGCVVSPMQMLHARDTGKAQASRLAKQEH